MLWLADKCTRSNGLLKVPPVISPAPVSPSCSFIRSPRLDSIGNSARGIEFCKEFGKLFSFHIFDTGEDEQKVNPLLNYYNSTKMNMFSELCLAAQRGDLEHLQILFQNSVDFDQSDYDGRTALHLAVCENHIEVVKFLVNIVKVNKEKNDRWGKIAKDETEDSEIIAILS